ncbi:OB-fold-containig protein [Niabella ginsengisoli]|uniref:DUF1449 family protein n=1 Tax=Niabella ginsengisoli TaxID=522298 RepID=A0ABS9SEW3_9BACT|nr:OB-fold-containig protein [Niabella ginsengisoli]MCH5596904.1 DUF1449 family protein [Niabella ginsengisoli]
MQDFFELAFSKVNFVPTLLAILFAIYWVITIFTGLDIEVADADVDVDADADTHHPDSQHSGDGVWDSILKFFYIGELPILFILSLVSIFMWLFLINVTSWLSWEDSWIGFVLYLPGFIIGLLITKVVALPFLKLYRMFNHKGEESIDFIGKVGAVVATVKTDKIGQIEIKHQGDVIRVYAKSMTEEEYKAGEQVIILEASPDQKFYLVQSYNL